MQGRRRSKACPRSGDEDRDTTKVLRGVFEGMVPQRRAPGTLLPRDAKVFVSDNIKQLKGPLGGQGPLKVFELLTDESIEGGKRRSYRATFEGGMKVRVNFFIDAEGKIAGANVRPE